MFTLQMNPTVAEGYKSNSQVARRITEGWATESLYCISCKSERVIPTPNNSAAIDFYCGICSAAYQLKASKRWDERRVPDAGYEAMVRALHSDSVPNLLLMQYTDDWAVKNLLVVPSFFFSISAVERRPPLGPNARRAGWIGCNIILSKIADEGKIRLVSDGNAVAAESVRADYDRIRPIARLDVKTRGWTLDVLRIVHKIGTREFDLTTAYKGENELASIYPANKNIRPKIRQQLQVLRDLGFIAFLGNGRYRLL